MLRRPFPLVNVKPLLRPKRSCNPCGKRHSGTGPRGGGRKFLASLVGVSALGVGGSIAYASYDAGFRKQIDQNIPFAEDILTPLIGPPSDGLRVSSASSSPIKPKSPALSTGPDDSLMKKKLERSKAKLDQEAIKTISSSSGGASVSQKPTSVPPPPLEIPKSAESKSTPLGEPSKLAANTEIKSKPVTEEENPVGIVKPVQAEKDSAIWESSSNHEATQVSSTPAPKPMDHSPEISSSLASEYRRVEDLEADFEKKIDLVRDEYEKELMKQLKRQVAVYLDHLNDQLHVQRAELERIQRLTEEDKILEIKDKYYSELSGALNKLHNIEAILLVRENLDQEETKARKLWLLCQSLKDSLKCNGLQKPAPLKDEISSMQKTIGALSIQSPVTLSILNNIPKNAIEEGVHNEDTIIERFNKVDKLCKRVALIGENGGSLGQYFLSYFQSLLLIDSVKIPESELTGKVQVDPSQWDTYEILARVKHSLNQRNIEQALRYANQLRGAPRKVAKDWIIDTRTHLEVRQAAELLQALAATITIRAVK